MRIILAILIWVAAASFAPAAITVTPGGGGGVITTNEFDGSAITSGTVADARIASTIARDSEVPAIMATNGGWRVFNVLAYGADHNSATTNDQLAIQAAIDAARSGGGGEIHLPEGNYYVRQYSQYPQFTSENQRSCFVLWSNCSWRITGPGQIVALPAVNGDLYCIFGSGDSVAAGTNYNWTGAQYVEIDNLKVDLNFATWPYDFTEIYASDRVIVRNCVAVNSAGADFFDAQAYRVSIVENCVFTNWQGSIFHPGGAFPNYTMQVLRNCLMVDCNTNALSTTPAIEPLVGDFVAENCIFKNSLYILRTAGNTPNSTFQNCTFTTGNGSGTATNFNVNSSAITFNNCLMLGVSADTQPGAIPAVVLTGGGSMVMNNSYVSLRALVRTSSGSTFKIANSELINSFITLNGSPTYYSSITACNIDRASFSFFDGTGANNILIADCRVNTFLSASGTNWVFSNNKLVAGGSLRDSTAGYCSFTGNRSDVLDSITSDIRLSGPKNIVSGNAISRLYFAQTTARTNTVSGNTIGAVSFANGATAATLRSGSFGENYDFNGNLIYSGIPGAWKSKTAGYTVAATDNFVVFNCSGGCTATLPDAAAVGAGGVFTLKNINTTALTVATTSSQTVDGAAPATLAQWGSRTYVSDGANWLTQ